VPGITLQAIDADDQSTFKDLTVIVDESEFGVDRDTLAKALKTEGIDTRPYFWPPVHQQQAYAHLDTGELPATDWVSSRVISLPLWRDMPAGSADVVVEVLAGIHAHAGEVVEAQALEAAPVGAAPETPRRLTPSAALPARTTVTYPRPLFADKESS
jgi:hypothetical protein